jgi:flagellin-specific chaperone FliS
MMAALQNIQNVEALTSALYTSGISSMPGRTSGTCNARPTTPFPPSASGWLASHAEQLNIFFVPIDESKYLYHHQQVNVGPVVDSVFLQVQKGQQKAASASALAVVAGRGRGRGCGRPTTTTSYEYDYKCLLRDAVNPGNQAWWDVFEETVSGDDFDLGVLDTILEQFNVPNVTQEQSLELLHFFSSTSRKAPLQPASVAHQPDLHSSSCLESSTQTKIQVPMRDDTTSYDKTADKTADDDDVSQCDSDTSRAEDIIRELIDGVAQERHLLQTIRNVYRNQSFDTILYQHFAKVNVKTNIRKVEV